MVVDLLLLLGLTLRVVRVVTFDDIGRWWIRAPAQRWALRHEPLPAPEAKTPPGTYRVAVGPYGEALDVPAAQTYTTQGYAAELAVRAAEEAAMEPQGWRSKLVSGADCPWCWGFWLAGLCLLSLLVAGGPGEAHWVWRAVAGWFTLNYVAAHIGPRLGDVG